MDKHEKGIEKVPGRLDRPLPEWKGDYGGDPRRLPKVIQKLLHGRILTAEEKAELLWRFFELDQRARERQARVRGWAIALVLGAVVAYVGAFHRAWVVEQIMAWLSPPPAGPPA
jgi:hypothetical protein